MKVGKSGLTLEQEARTIGDDDFLEVRDGANPFAAVAAGGRGGRTDRIDRHRGQSLGHEVGPEYAAEFGGRERAQAFEVSATVIEIADHDLGDPEPRGLAGHGLARVDFADHDLAEGLGNELGGKPARDMARELALDGGGGRLAFVSIAGEGNVEEPAGARIPGMGIDGVNETRLFADGLPENGAVAISQDGGEQVERGRIRMRQSGNLPAKAGPRELHLLKAVLLAPGKLPGFVGQRHGRQPGARNGTELLLNDLADGGGVKGADHDEHEIVGHVARAVVGEQVFAGDAGNHVAIADDGMAVRVLAESRGKEHLAEAVVGIILPHVDLAQNDVTFPRHLVSGQRGVQHGIGENIDGHGGVLGGQVDVIDGVVKGGIGVDIAAMRLDGGGDLPARAAAGAFEKHVLEKMREAGAELRLLVNAAGFHPGLHGGDGGGGVAFEQDGEPVGENQSLGGITPETLQQGEVDGGGTHERSNKERPGEGRNARPEWVPTAATCRRGGHTELTGSAEGPARRLPAGWNGFTNASSKS